MFKIILFLLFLPIFTLYSQDYYKSNSFGLPLKKINPLLTDSEEFVLKIEKKPGKLLKTLLKENTLFKKWVIKYSRSGLMEEEIFYEGRKKTVKRFKNKLISDERFYNENKLTAVNKYIHTSEGKISALEKYSPDGELISRKVYDSPDSIKVERYDSQNSNTVSKYSVTGTDIRSEWQGDSEGTGLFFYYSSGQVSYLEKWEKGNLVSRTDYYYKDGKLEKTLENLLSLNIKLIRFYNQKGQVIKETEKNGDSVTRTEYNTYSEDKIVKKIIKTLSVTEKYLYIYENDKLSRELHYHNGSLIKKTVYQEGQGNYYEDLYSNNVKYMRVYYLDGEKDRIEH